MRNPPYTLTMPARRSTPVVFSSPHSGRDYSRAFRRAAVLGQRALRSSEDAFIDLLFADAPTFGAPLLAAVAPRAYLDLNRGPDELDPALVRGVRAVQQNPRIASGLGVIPRVVSGGREIYRGKLQREEAERRLETWWQPYHDRLKMLLDESHSMFGQAILIDCHSMPNEAIRTLCRAEKSTPEIVLGDRHGTAADAGIVDRIEAAFVAAGLKVARNKPFAGAYIAQHYGVPARGRHVVQIEIDRALYMNEAALRPNNNFASLKKLLNDIIAQIVELGREQKPLAAE
ncbi:MAG TPA: N-formylglutamate amidohydrolase [Aliiroseovarius sp.]|nr:N-formylglutamate amidohydrolase [Aliiroseovarius sp.]